MSTKLYITFVRTVRTFVASFVGTLLVTNGSYSEQTIWAATIAGVIAVLNLVSAPTT